MEEDTMTTYTPAPARTIWKDTRAIVPTAKACTSEPAQAERPKSASQSQVPAEKEADRWVAEMMFDHYNG
jgi:hypothetical protein